MTNQEVFTKVVQHLRTQGVPSEADAPGGRRCLYRHTDGIRRCAVGVLIPDSEYKPEMEIQYLSKVAIIPSLRFLDFSLLERLQVAHDGTPLPGYTWRESMEWHYQEIARDFKLQVPPHPCLEESTNESHQPSRESEAHLCTQQA